MQKHVTPSGLREIARLRKFVEDEENSSSSSNSSDDRQEDSLSSLQYPKNLSPATLRKKRRGQAGSPRQTALVDNINTARLQANGRTRHLAPSSPNQLDREAGAYRNSFKETVGLERKERVVAGTAHDYSNPVSTSKRVANRELGNRTPEYRHLEPKKGERGRSVDRQRKPRSRSHSSSSVDRYIESLIEAPAVEVAGSYSDTSWKV